MLKGADLVLNRINSSGRARIELNGEVTFEI